MARKKPALYTIVFIDEDGDLAHATFGDDLDGAKKQLATLPDGKARLFSTEPIPFSIGIIIGTPAAPARKKPAAKRGKAKPENGTRFNDDGSPVAGNPDLEA